MVGRHSAVIESMGNEHSGKSKNIFNRELMNESINENKHYSHIAYSNIKVKKVPLITLMESELKIS